jgi:Zn-dependent protease/CBS domain-containing protein
VPIIIYFYKNIRIHYSWVVVFPLLLWSFEQAIARSTAITQLSALLWGLAGTFLFIFSLFLHEIGHFVSSKFFNVGLQKAFLFQFGSVHVDDFFTKPTISHVLVALSGPLTSCIVAIGWSFLLITISLPPKLILLFNYLVILNFLLAIVNLLPFYPLDLGVAFRFVTLRMKNANDEMVFPIGNLFLICAFLIGLHSIYTGYFYNGIWWIICSISFKMALRIANQKRYLLEEMRGEKVGDYMRVNPITVHPSITLDKFMREYYYRYYESIFPVVQYSFVHGVITNENIRKIPDDQWKDYTVGEIADPLSADNATTKDTDIVDILKKIADRSDHNLLVVKDETLEGVLTIEDLLPYFSLKVNFSPRQSTRYYVRKEKRPAEEKSEPSRVHSFPDRS